MLQLMRCQYCRSVLQTANLSSTDAGILSLWFRLAWLSSDNASSHKACSNDAAKPLQTLSVLKWAMGWKAMLNCDGHGR